MIGNKDEIIEYLEEDKIYECKEVKTKDLLSRAQQKYYFGIVIPTISNFHGYTVVETHELIKIQFKLETTTGLSKEEFKFMIDMIRDLWMTNFELYIPLPTDLAGDESLYNSLGF